MTNTELIVFSGISEAVIVRNMAPPLQDAVWLNVQTNNRDLITSVTPNIVLNGAWAPLGAEFNDAYQIYQLRDFNRLSDEIDVTQNEALRTYIAGRLGLYTLVDRNLSSGMFSQGFIRFVDGILPNRVFSSDASVRGLIPRNKFFHPTDPFVVTTILSHMITQLTPRLTSDGLAYVRSIFNRVSGTTTLRGDVGGNAFGSGSIHLSDLITLSGALRRHANTQVFGDLFLGAVSESTTLQGSAMLIPQGSASEIGRVATIQILKDEIANQGHVVEIFNRWGHPLANSSQIESRIIADSALASRVIADRSVTAEDDVGLPLEKFVESSTQRSVSLVEDAGASVVYDAAWSPPITTGLSNSLAITVRRDQVPTTVPDGVFAQYRFHVMGHRDWYARWEVYFIKSSNTLIMDSLPSVGSGSFESGSANVLHESVETSDATNLSMQMQIFRLPYSSVPQGMQVIIEEILRGPRGAMRIDVTGTSLPRVTRIHQTI